MLTPSPSWPLCVSVWGSACWGDTSPHLQTFAEGLLNFADWRGVGLLWSRHRSSGWSCSEISHQMSGCLQELIMLVHMPDILCMPLHTKGSLPPLPQSDDYTHSLLKGLLGTEMACLRDERLGFWEFDSFFKRVKKKKLFSCPLEVFCLVIRQPSTKGGTKLHICVYLKKIWHNC